MVCILTEREKEAIDKKLRGEKLSQQDSNCLSRYVRPKLREISLIDSRGLLKKLEYNRKKKHNEDKIKRLILENVKDVEVIVLCGSVVYNDWSDYEDIDIIIGVGKKSWEKLRDKWKIIWNLKDKAKKKGLDLDVKIFLKKDIINSYSSNPTLIYQLKDRKVIYGDLKLSDKIEIPKLAIRMHLDYSFLADKNSDAKELYSMIRNAWLVKLIISKIVDNLKLNQLIKDELGENLIYKLKLNKANANERKIALLYINYFVNNLWKEVMKGKWEKIVL